jgi:hypothetical protein
MKKTSNKRAKQEREYKQNRLKYFENNPFCEARATQNCGFKASEIHHRQGRNGDRLNDTAFFMAVCRSCHNYIHNNPAESYLKGWLIRKN